MSDGEESQLSNIAMCACYERRNYIYLEESDDDEGQLKNVTILEESERDTSVSTHKGWYVCLLRKT